MYESEEDDQVINARYPTELDPRVYRPGAFHAPKHSLTNRQEALAQRLKFCRMETQRMERMEATK